MSTSHTPCERFEQEGLLLLERGLSLDAHFDTCPDCRLARANYEELGRQIAESGRELEPPGDWQARVWAGVARREEARKKRRGFWWIAAPALAAVLALALGWRLLEPSPGPPETVFEVTVFEVTVSRGDGVERGADAQRGDVLHLRAQVERVAFAEIRVYRDDAELLLRCSSEPPCRRSGVFLEADLEMGAIGTYQSVLLRSARPLPGPTGQGLDADAGVALAGGAEFELGDAVRVR